MNNISSQLFILPALLWSIAAYQMSAAKAAHWSHLWWTVCLPQDLCQCCNQGCWTLFSHYCIGGFLFVYFWSSSDSNIEVAEILNSSMVWWCFFFFNWICKFVIENSLWILALPRRGLSVWVPELISPAVSS